MIGATMASRLRVAALASGLALAACATGPGPIEIQANAAASSCNAGRQEACQNALLLGNMANLERYQRKQENDQQAQAAVSFFTVLLAILIGLR